VNSIGFMQGRLSPLIDNKIQSFPWTNWQKEFQIASANNLRTIEWTIDQERLYENPLLTEIGTKEIKNLCKKYQIKIPSLTGDCFMQNPFWKATGTKKKKLQNDFINILYACNKVNISIVLVPLVDNGSIENTEQENNLLNFLTSQKELIKRLSLRIGFESDYSPKRLKSFIDKFDDDTFGINYDTGNSSCLGFNPIDEFAEYGKRIINVHIKDRPFGGSTVPLGKGDANFLLIFQMLREYNYNGNFILQTARAEDDDHLGVLLKYQNTVLEFAKNTGIIRKNI
tara:strand:+ start:2250 stop:3101 length:852 start_codon:yes stop_codon:yes gene_type:complete